MGERPQAKGKKEEEGKGEEKNKPTISRILIGWKVGKPPPGWFALYLFFSLSPSPEVEVMAA